jgi:hypothetical protein
MKTNSTHIVLVRAILFVIILLYSLLVFGRGDHSPLRISTWNVQKKEGKQIGNSFVIVKRK